MPAQQARARSRIRGASSTLASRGSSSGTVIPFDHAATFALRGIPGNIVQDVINVSTDGIFVALAIGYGFEEDRARSAELIFPPPPPQDFLPSAITLGQIPSTALIEGFRISPQLQRLVFEEPVSTTGSRPITAREPRFSNTRIDRTFGASLLERIKPAEEISFLFSIVDSGTGRELQDEPIHNLASLGSSDGVRPFRLLAQPLMFQPRSTVRLQIVERSEGVDGTLFIVLYGYKILGAAVCPEPVTRALSAPAIYPGQSIGNGSGRVIPFDYVSKFQLTGRPGNLIEDEVPINAEGGFVNTSIGYGLAVESLNVTLSGLPPVPAPPAPPPTIDLGVNISLGQFPTGALLDGIRIRPNFLRIAFGDNGQLNRNLPVTSVNQIFERLNRPESVSFRYSITDTGTGRDLQNQPIHNVAGLGIATGERPFKRLGRPMTFLPRSTVRVTVEEHFGRGTLFIVFQGYKLLSAPPGIQTASPPRRSRRR